MSQPCIINVYTYAAWFSVESVHGSRLEFVLAAVEERNHKAQDFYSDELWKLMNGRLRPYRDDAIVERQLYGDVNFLIHADSQSQLNDMLAICEAVVVTWSDIYRVQFMKERS